MKTVHLLFLLLVPLALIGLGGCKVKSEENPVSANPGGDSTVTVCDGTSGTTPVLGTFPTQLDMYEGTGCDNAQSSAGTISVDSGDGINLQKRTIYPQGDTDWAKVLLQGGKTYEIFANDLNFVGDTKIYLYDASSHLVASNDDYISFDSDVQFTPGADGTFYIEVVSSDIHDMATYQLGVRQVVDSDHDGYSATYDCNDSNPNAYPYATEIPDNGIDEDCSGADLISGADGFESDDDFALANLLFSTQTDIGEINFSHALYSVMHTIDPADDTDFYTFAVAAKSGAYVVDMSQGPYPVKEAVYGSQNLADISGFDDNYNSGTIFIPVVNTGTSEHTYYLSVASFNAVNPTWYATALIPIGTDKDGDGYYTLDWAADCNDNDANIHPYSTVSPDGHTDWNCNGDLYN